MFRDGKLSEFASTDLLRMYEVMDGIYDEYLERTSETRPPENCTMEQALKMKADEQKFLRDSKLRNVMEAKYVTKLELKNRRRIRELGLGLELPKRKRALTHKDFESYERERKTWAQQQEEKPKNLD